MLQNNNMKNETNVLKLKKQFKNIFKKIIRDKSDISSDSIDEAALPAYAHNNFFIDKLFWDRLRIVEKYIKSNYENLEKDLHILDFGSGSGVMSYTLGSNGYKVYMTDIDKIPIQYVKKYTQFPSSVEWIDTDKLSNYRGVFDIIIALDVLEHVDSINDVLSQFKTLTKENGEVIISGPTENVFYRTGRRIAGRRFTGHYHKTTINDIKETCKISMNVKTIKVLYPIIPFFDIFSGKFKK